MSVVRVGLAKGHDPFYPQRSTGEPGREVKPGDYYNVISEPRGRVLGRGAEALGFVQGQEVTKEQYERVIAERKHPETGENLGRNWNAGRKAREKTEAIYQAKLATEPHATQQRRWQLHRDAVKESKESIYYMDATASLVKSITIFGESLIEAARQARLAGDKEGAAERAAEVVDLEQIIYDADAAAMRFFEREAGYCRQGYHGSRVDGQESGRFHEAGLVIFPFFQHTSRDDDPHWHIHNVIAMACRADNDGKWRVPDTYGYNKVIPAVASVFGMRLWSAMTARYGVGWVRREGDRGHEIAGITPAMVNVYSGRRNTIRAELDEWIAKYPEAHKGRKPTQREINRKSRALSKETREGKEGPPDFKTLREGWARDFLAATGERLEDVASSVRPAALGAGAGRGAEFTPGLRRQVARMALSKVQAEKSAWTRYDLMRQLGEVMAPEAASLDPDAAEQLLYDMTDEILAGDYQAVTALDVPEIVDLPPELIRADGKSVYRRHMLTEYATRVQISQEEQLLEDATTPRQPLVERQLAARLLGSDAATLEAQAQLRPEAGSDAKTRTGLRLDQAAAIWSALTSRKTASVLIGPPGAGKTFALGAAAAAAKQAGVPEVYGITCSQAARNVLAEQCEQMGVKIRAWNSTQFTDGIALPPGHPGRIEIAPGSLFLLDEASMTSVDHYAKIMRMVVRTGGAAIPAGDQGQLTAPQGGGALGLMTRKLGYVQISEPVRFRAMWERDAVLRLRHGDETVLDVYDQHGRIRGGTPEEMLEQAAQTAVNYLATAEDVLLMAASREDCRELSRRVRGELVRLGVVGDGRAVPLAEGAEASVDDLIILRRNDHPRGLANGDVVRIETIEGDGRVRIRKAAGRDPGTGEPVFGCAMSYGSLEQFDSAYATTAHSAEGRSVTVGLPYVTGSESRQWLTVAMTRGGRENIAFVASNSPKAADPKAGVRAAPELARKERLDAGHVGQELAPYEEEPGVADPLAVLVGVMRRDDTELSAIETRQRAAANADHLALLAPMWDDAISALRSERYRQVLAEAVPEAYRPGIDDSPKVTWLWRTLRQAEASGLDAREVVREAVQVRDLAGSQDVAAVIDRRIRDRLGDVTPEPAGTWWSELPEGAPEYVRQLARLQDGREVRLGQQDAIAPPAWATEVLGPVPEDAEERARWEDRAGRVHAYRDRYGYKGPDPIGAEPNGNNPEQRARWHRAVAALGPVDGIDLRGEETGRLLLMRDAYRHETAWAPRFAAPALREARLKVAFAEQAVRRAEAEQRAAEKAGDLDSVARHAKAAGTWQRQLDESYRKNEAQLAKAHQAYQDWDHTVKHALQQARAADAVLQRREPGLVREPLRTAEPEPVTEEEIAQLDGAAPSWLDDLTHQAEKVQEEIASRQSIREPGEDPDGAQAWPAPGPLERDAIIHPPEPAMPPAPQLEHGWEPGWDRDIEAGQ